MSMLDRKGMSQDKRFRYALILAIITGIAVGIGTGLLRGILDTSLFLLLVGYLVAYVIRRYGRGVQTRFSVLGIIVTLCAIFLSDVVASYGLMAIFNIQSYSLVIQFIFYSDGNQWLWIATRVLSLFIAYTYSRVI